RCQETPASSAALPREISLVRPLLNSEVVHHRNGCKTDNRIQNLELFESARELGVERQRRNPHPGYRRVELEE
ncbi:MAG TPA: HNH endonuclease, partial [Anaerolineae bacterium]|nr:HNH endonuclease [Anaerolineae bacterium]